MFMGLVHEVAEFLLSSLVWVSVCRAAVPSRPYQLRVTEAPGHCGPRISGPESIQGLRTQHVPIWLPLALMPCTASSCLSSLKACCRTWCRLKASACLMSFMAASRSPSTLDTGLCWHSRSIAITCFWTTSTLASAGPVTLPGARSRLLVGKPLGARTVFLISGSTKLSPGSMKFPEASRNPPSASTSPDSGNPRG